MEMSEQINELAAALSKAQAAIQGALKSSANTYFKSQYADLQSVWAACRKPLTDNGLSILQSPSADGARVTVDTMLLHASGQWIRGSMSCTGKDDSPQSVGSCTSYLKRYALQSFAGVAPEDDDAEAAQPRTGPEKQAARTPATATAHFATGDLGSVVVEKVGPGRAGSKGEITFTNGDTLLAYDAKIVTAAEAARKAGTAVAITVKQSTSGNRYLASLTDTHLSGAELAATKFHHGVEPLDASQIPFLWLVPFILPATALLGMVFA